MSGMFEKLQQETKEEVAKNLLILNKLSVEEIRETELNMLKIIKDFCNEHNLTYYLSNGTLLGAVKYKGFIPWDDDIDIFLPREDYDYLVEHFVDTFPYVLFSTQRVKEFRFPFAKLCDMTTRRIEDNNDNGVELGMDIDIFPLDTWHEDAVRQVKKQCRTLTFLRLAKNRRIVSTNPLRTLTKRVTAVFCKMFSASYFIKKMQKRASQYYPESKNLGCVVWPVYGANEIIPKEVFSQTIEVEFEGEKFSAPVGYDTYLRSLYGNYEEDPPLEKQKTHHRFTAYRV